MTQTHAKLSQFKYVPDMSWQSSLSNVLSYFPLSFLEAIVMAGGVAEFSMGLSLHEHLNTKWKESERQTWGNRTDGVDAGQEDIPVYY